MLEEDGRTPAAFVAVLSITIHRGPHRGPGHHIRRFPAFWEDPIRAGSGPIVVGPRLQPSWVSSCCYDRKWQTVCWIRFPISKPVQIHRTTDSFSWKIHPLPHQPNHEHGAKMTACGQSLRMPLSISPLVMTFYRTTISQSTGQQVLIAGQCRQVGVSPDPASNTSPRPEAANIWYMAAVSCTYHSRRPPEANPGKTQDNGS